MENHNWTQPANQFTGPIQQIFQNPSAPFINSLVDGSAYALVNGSVVHLSEQVAYATNYHNVLATPEAETILISILPSPTTSGRKRAPISACSTINDPFAANGPTNQDTDLHLTGLLTAAGRTWRSYQEDIDLTRDGAGKLTNVPLPKDQWTVPLTSFSGTFATGFFNDFNLGHSVQLRRQAQSDGVLHQYQRRQ